MGAQIHACFLSVTLKATRPFLELPVRLMVNYQATIRQRLNNKGTSKNKIWMVPLGTLDVKIRFFHFFYNEKSNF